MDLDLKLNPVLPPWPGFFHRLTKTAESETCLMQRRVPLPRACADFGHTCAKARAAGLNAQKPGPPPPLTIPISAPFATSTGLRITCSLQWYCLKAGPSSSASRMAASRRKSCSMNAVANEFQRQQTSEQQGLLTAVINEAIGFQPSYRIAAMRCGLLLVQNVNHINVAYRHQIVGNKATMASPPQPFGAHTSRTSGGAWSASHKSVGESECPSWRGGQFEFQ